VGHAQLGSGKVRGHIRCIVEVSRSRHRRSQKKMLPVSVHGLATACGQRNSLKPGSRTSVPGQQSPVTPSADITRTRRVQMQKRRIVPEARPSPSRSLVLQHQSSVGQRQHRAEAPVHRSHLYLSVRGKLTGTRDLRKNTSFHPRAGRPGCQPPARGRQPKHLPAHPCSAARPGPRRLPLTAPSVDGRPATALWPHTAFRDQVALLRGRRLDEVAKADLEELPALGH